MFRPTNWGHVSHPICYRLPIRVILFIVYTAFCDSVADRIWNKYGVILTVEVLLIFVCLFGTVSLLIYLTSRAARLNREDAIAVYFCSVKKTLAMGVPLAMLIFGSRADLSLILLPIMFYHPFQLLVNGLLLFADVRCCSLTFVANKNRVNRCDLTRGREGVRWFLLGHESHRSGSEEFLRSREMIPG